MSGASRGVRLDFAGSIPHEVRMSGSSANVRSIDVIRQFRTLLLQYDHDMRDAVTSLLLEARRAQQWVENDRGAYWPQAAREASDKLIQAKNLLEQCELAARPEDKRSCIDEKKAVQKAKKRLDYCEDQVRLSRAWRSKFRREAEEFQGAMARLQTHLELDMPTAAAYLSRLADALDKYAAAEPPPSGEQLTQAARQVEKRDPQ